MWFAAATRCAWLLVDFGEYELAEAHLLGVVDALDSRRRLDLDLTDVDVKRRFEAQRLFVALYTNWRKLRTTRAPARLSRVH